MYQKIEKEFVVKSQYYNINRILLATIIIISIVLCSIISIKPELFNTKIIILVIIILFCLIMLLLYVYIIHYIKHSINIKMNQYLQIEKIIALYKKIRYDDDLIQFGIILENHKIKTKDKISELINHYRAIMPKTNKASSNFISFVSLVISLIALLSSEFLLSNEYILYMCLLLIMLSIMLYYIVSKIMSYFNLFYSKSSLYEMLEIMASEIYIKEILNI